MKCLLIAILLLMPLRLFALDVEFGPEFTFAPEIGGDPGVEERIVLTKLMWNHLVKNQKAAAKFSKKEIDEDYTQFESPNGWSFTVSNDPGVIEVQMRPMTVEMYEHYKVDIQDAIFASASNLRFFPARFTGGGHINMSCTAFRNNPLLFRNFLVDLYNHNELFLGVFGYDTNNAISWNLKDNAAAFAQTIQAFDAGDYTSNFVEFVSDIDMAMNTNMDRFVKIWDKRSPDLQIREPRIRGARTHMINLDNVETQNRFEIRAIRPQASVDMWVRQIRLFKKRLEYLEKMKAPIPIAPIVPMAGIDIVNKEHHLNPPVQAQAALRAFYQYVTEAGEQWQDHRDYLWPDWIENGELDRFEKSDWFQRREPLTEKSCEEKLTG